MPHAKADDGVKIYYEETGEGAPVIFVHEYAGDLRSWEPQLRHFSRRYRCIAFNARGYPPSDVPEEVGRYSQDLARDDIKAVLDQLGIDKAHVVGLSMGGFATLHFGLAYPGRARSLVVAGCGYGAEADKRGQFKEEVEKAAHFIDSQGIETFAESYGKGPTRVQFETKDPRGWREFAEQLAEHSQVGMANTLRGVQGGRPSLWQLEDAMKKLTVPVLLMTGDEDEPCLAPSLYMKRTIGSSGLVVVPRSGHTINIEEPDAFNRAVADFYAQVEAGRWGSRDPRSVTVSILGER